MPPLKRKSRSEGESSAIVSPQADPASASVGAAVGLEAADAATAAASPPPADAPTPPPPLAGISAADAYEEKDDAESEMELNTREWYQAVQAVGEGKMAAPTAAAVSPAPRDDSYRVLKKATLCVAAEVSPATVTEVRTVVVDPDFPLTVVYQTKSGELSTEVYPFANQALQGGLMKKDALGVAADLARVHRNFGVVSTADLARQRPRSLSSNVPLLSDVPLVAEVTSFLRHAKELLVGTLPTKESGGQPEGEDRNAGLQGELRGIGMRARGYLKRIVVSSSRTRKTHSKYEVEGFQTYAGKASSLRKAIAIADAIADEFDEDGSEVRNRPALGTGLPTAGPGRHAKHPKRLEAARRFSGVSDAVFVSRLAFSVERLAHRAELGDDDKTVKVMLAEEARWEYGDAVGYSSKHDASFD